MVKNAENLAARLRNDNSGAEMKFVEYPGQTHGTVIPAFFFQELPLCYRHRRKPLRSDVRESTFTLALRPLTPSC